MISPIVWVGFITLVILLMAIDLGLLNRKAHIPTAREALLSTGLWVALAGLFGIFIYFAYNNHWLNLGKDPFEPLDGKAAALRYYTGYLLEESLSIDNLFVIALVFTRFQVPKKYQHRILFWGIVGVLVFRGILIAVGTELVHHFVFLFYVFGGLLLYSAWKMWRHNDEPADAEDFDRQRIVRLLRRFFPVTRHHDGGRFFVIENGRRAATSLFVALVVVEITDVIFAFDSVPAVFGITTDPFLVFSSNIFAILGLRSLYFVLSDILDRFERLRYSLIAILFFIGVKLMLIPQHVDLPEWVSLGVIALLLGGGVLASVWERK